MLYIPNGNYIALVYMWNIPREYVKWSENMLCVTRPSNFLVAEAEVWITIYIQQTEGIRPTLINIGLSCTLFYVTSLHGQTQMKSSLTPSSWVYLHECLNHRMVFRSFWWVYRYVSCWGRRCDISRVTMQGMLIQTFVRTLQGNGHFGQHNESKTLNRILRKWVLKMGGWVN
jgi:hypothetical protein